MPLRDRGTVSQTKPRATSGGAVEGVDGCPASMLKSQERGMRFNNVDNTTSNGAYPSDDDDLEEERMVREYARRLENGAPQFPKLKPRSSAAT